MAIAVNINPISVNLIYLQKGEIPVFYTHKKVSMGFHYCPIRLFIRSLSVPVWAKTLILKKCWLTGIFHSLPPMTQSYPFLSLPAFLRRIGSRLQKNHSTNSQSLLLFSLCHNSIFLHYILPPFIASFVSLSRQGCNLLNAAIGILQELEFPLLPLK